MSKSNLFIYFKDMHEGDSKIAILGKKNHQYHRGTRHYEMLFRPVTDIE